MKMRSLLSTASMALVAALAVLIAAPLPSTAQTEPYEINAILPLTG
jgi:hypothetical protein